METDQDPTEALDEFTARHLNDWLTPFCQARGYSHDGFDGRAIRMLSAADACDFMQAIDLGLVTHQCGFFSAARSKAKEQIFWQGPRASIPRKVSLWIEPIITIGGLRRLHRDFQWPAGQLGLQSKTWAFDLVAYDRTHKLEAVVCEVKKTEREVEMLLKFMQQHLDTPADVEMRMRGPERNAFKKVLALRESASTVFWALGPDRYGHVFKVGRNARGAITLHCATESALEFPG